MQNLISCLLIQQAREDLGEGFMLAFLMDLLGFFASLALLGWLYCNF